MRRPSPLPSTLLAIAVLAATACSEPPEDTPITWPAPGPVVEYVEERGYSPTSSEISPDQEQLCLPDDGQEGQGEDDQPTCETEGEMRWSQPLEADHFVRYRGGYTFPIHTVTDPGLSLAAGTPEGVLYAENPQLYMVDPATGELSWNKDLREEDGTAEVDFLETELRSVNATDQHLLLHFREGLLRLTQDGEYLSHFTLPACQGELKHASAEEVVFGNCDGNASSIFRLDTGERTTSHRRAFEEELTETLLTSSLDNHPHHHVRFVDGGPFNAFVSEPHWGPPGLGTVHVASIPGEGRPQEDQDWQGLRITVLVACIPDGVGESSPENASPGLPCEGARLYAVNG
ncbi:hypothetical protein [Nocardiopsis valliformis]|uniref:hypothetical protein n=1 Tax=Nocardiopsis valliformis TaxID=239974 RepID=UPI00034AC344|nr:hypothetical protein [Nocardiopsis valliformis]